MVVEYNVNTYRHLVIIIIIIIAHHRDWYLRLLTVGNNKLPTTQQ